MSAAGVFDDVPEPLLYHHVILSVRVGVGCRVILLDLSSVHVFQDVGHGRQRFYFVGLSYCRPLKVGEKVVEVPYSPSTNLNTFTITVPLFGTIFFLRLSFSRLVCCVNIQILFIRI